MVTEVEAVRKCKTQRKFKVVSRYGTQGKRKDFLCKAACKEDRDGRPPGGGER